jgi:hypothetical protein
MSRQPHCPTGWGAKDIPFRSDPHWWDGTASRLRAERAVQQVFREDDTFAVVEKHPRAMNL